MESTQYKLPPNPCDSANCLSKILFAWTVPFFKKNAKVLKLDDMFQPMTCDKSETLGNRLETNWVRSTSKADERNSLLSVILYTFWRDYAFLSVCCFFNDIVFRLGQPFLLGYLLKYFRKDTQIAYHDAVLYATGIVVMNALNALLINHIHYVSYHNGMKVRVSVCSLIYRKSLRLSQTALGDTSPGKVVNLLSNDVNRFEWATFFMNALWTAPLLTLLVGCLMWNEIRWTGLVGILVVFCVVPMLSYAGKLTSKYRLQTASRTDERIRFMDEIISGVQVIKMYAWEKPFAKLITYTRSLELKMVRKTSYIRAFHMTSMLFTTRMALFCTMMIIILVHGPQEITSARIFVITSYFNIVSHLMSQRFSRGIAETAEVLVALKRLEKFLYLEEKQTNFGDDKLENGLANGLKKGKVKMSDSITSNVSVSMKNVSACWTIPANAYLSSGKFNQNGKAKDNRTTMDEMQVDECLSHLNVDFPKGMLIGIIGPVGSGKSSLLQAILRELPLKTGSISVNGSISYASQEPWVFAASVRQNILFGQKYDQERYNKVVRICALEKDFEQFENGDRTIVGERGASLSGGQKARINLARACYRNSDIYLFDDPLSAVDTHVGTHIFNKCIGPASSLSRQRSTRILVTHQVHFLKEADWLIVLKDGRIEIQGTPSELYKSDVDFIELVGMTETPDVTEIFPVFSRQCSTISTQSESSIESMKSVIGRSVAAEQKQKETKDEGVPMEAISKAKGSLSWNYFSSGAHWSVLLMLLFSFVFVQCLASATDYFVSIWTKQEEIRTHVSPNDTSITLTTNECISIQGTLVAALLIFGISRSIGFYSICVRISQNIHNAMFKGIISTKMRFFDTNPSGRILNRFSKDIGAVDEILPKNILDATQNILSMFGSIVIALVVNPYFLIPLLVLSIFFVFIRSIYLKTSRKVKRLEGIAKSPAYTHLSATLSGLSTVRAYKAEEILKKEFDNHQDTHSSCWFIIISTTSVFGFCLDFMCLLFIASIVYYYVLFDTGVSGEKIGLAISQAISLTGLVPWGVRQSAEISNQMTAVERVLEYRDLEPEKQPKKLVILVEGWPSKGCIEFRNVFYRYFAEAEPVLRGLSFVINPMEKIGIVGRTGAGKSSLIGSLFRLACIEGQIQIDGVDTANIQLSDLRKQIAIIPQDPVLFSGTLRRNLDPFEDYSDDDIWSALESVELKSAISETLGLQSTVLPHGANYSVGQRQLLCLAKWQNQLAKTKRPSLLAAIVATFWREYISYAFVCAFSDLIARLGQPLLLGKLLRFFRDGSDITQQDAMKYAGLLVLFNCLYALGSNQFFMLGYHNGMKIRVAVCSIIYRKALRLSQTALGETSPGKVVNLLSNDVGRFEWVSLCLNSMWIAPLLSFIVACLLWIEIGAAGLIGIAIIFTVVPIQSYTGKLSSKFRLKTALRTDQRIRFMDEIINGVQVIKIYAWEKPFSNLVSTARKMELNIIRKTSFVRGLYMTFNLFTTRAAVFCTMLAIALLYGSDQITADKVFVISSYFSIISMTMGQIFVRGVAEIAEALVALKRLQTFLELDEKQTKEISDGVNGFRRTNGNIIDKIEMEFTSENSTPPNVAVSMRNVTAIWTVPSIDDATKKKNVEKAELPDEITSLIKSPTLDNFSVDFPKGKLIGIIGPVGSGKSSLLQVLLRELSLESGSLHINGSVSYASQEPWVFAASVRQNILFGNEYDQDRYNAVVKSCALETDFNQFENGDRTIVGEKGSLSGGQKARINLARACYRNADIYLFDDPLSAVDAHVGTHIFNKCLGLNGRLARQQRATRILVTHQVHFLKEADWLVVLNDGKIEIQGSPTDLAQSGVDFAKLVGIEEESSNEENISAVSRSRKSSILSTSSSGKSSIHESEQLNEHDEEEPKDEGVQMEESSKGKVKGSVSASYFKAGANCLVLFVLGFSFVFVQILGSGADYWVSVWTKQEEMRATNNNQYLTNELNNTSTRQLVDKSNVSDTKSTDSFKPESLFILSTEMCIYIHGALIASVFVIGIMRSFAFYIVCMRASQKLYNSMFNGVISTTMRFFDTNPAGRILNRFSKDIGTIDEWLPKAILDGTQSILTLSGSIVITAMVSPYFLIPVLVMGLIFIYIRKVYLKTSKNIKRIEGIAKSPAFTHLSATLSGLSTVRAFNAEKLLQNEFDHHQDTHSACWYMFVATSSAFGLILDIMCWTMIVCIIAFYLLIDTGASSEMVGLALTQVLTLTGMLQWGVRQSAEVSNLMTSVERVLEYRDLEPEKQPEKPQEVSENWPKEGSIEFRNVIYKYFEGADPVLRDLSFVIKPKEKIGIVGRTGAGKSSLIGAIFRLACIDGQILIDGIDTANLRLRDLRKRVAIIPQDPVLFSGTLRRNLDPFEEYPDAEIWHALEKVELKEAATEPSGLQSPVMARGANYSIGQRQLLCLARAILRKNRILVLDEATANVDPQTDLLIQQTIREKFAECTVLTVAHRLHTIIDSDRVLVMDAGQAAEFDNPYTLLQNTLGIFHGMVEALGTSEFSRLSRIAQEKFDSIHKTE
ncbi:ATP-binding cassette subfamily C member 4-like [Sitodiplosis mosellana]|uniref:ATP-binding cassette subfamily C member 4-like n=1 Tax=Sitodiplosis mosellana TaxID=263140 RepID=UPI0024438925|nr:ATP-binding cassette subfamily C member 4-like [Sitodiplosis mosellana]